MAIAFTALLGCADASSTSEYAPGFLGPPNWSAADNLSVKEGAPNAGCAQCHSAASNKPKLRPPEGRIESIEVLMVAPRGGVKDRVIFDVSGREIRIHPEGGDDFRLAYYSNAAISRLLELVEAGRYFDLAGDFAISSASHHAIARVSVTRESGEVSHVTDMRFPDPRHRLFSQVVQKAVAHAYWYDG